jgi:hypothetical protein
MVKPKPFRGPPGGSLPVQDPCLYDPEDFAVVDSEDTKEALQAMKQEVSKSLKSKQEQEAELFEKAFNEFFFKRLKR